MHLPAGEGEHVFPGTWPQLSSLSPSKCSFSALVLNRQHINLRLDTQGQSRKSIPLRRNSELKGLSGRSQEIETVCQIPSSWICVISSYQYVSHRTVSSL